MSETDESQPWDDEPEIEADANANDDGSEGETGLGEEMVIVAATLSVVVIIWSFFGTVPRPVILLTGLWIMAGTIGGVAEVYAA